jgi:hypothetical protein
MTKLSSFVANPDWNSLLSYDPLTGVLTNKVTHR